MESLLKLPVARKGMVRILQITDTHLFTGEHETLLGVNTLRSYHAVLNAIIAERYPFDLVVATGDLTQDQSSEACQHFAEGVIRLPAPCVWLPGNHDDQPAMADVFAQAGIVPSRQVLLSEHWQVILLDSQVVGASYGVLSQHQLEWMEYCLLAYPQRYSLVLLHHHPMPSGCAWLDQHRLLNAHMLAAVVTRYPRVSVLMCGHIHQELDNEWYGKRLLASPSTCVQFKPNCTNFTLDVVAPGWRYLDLLPDGVVETRVHRLPGNQFHPIMDVEGY